MPELPEVETVRRGLAPVLEGRRIERVELRRPDLRLPFPDDFVQRIAGQTVAALDRRAKYLLCRLGNGTVIIMHLGMSGRFSIVAPETETEIGTETDPSRAIVPSARTTAAILDTRPSLPAGQAVPGQGIHDHVVFHLDDGTRIVYADHRRFGLMTLSDAASVQAHPLLARSGVEPLGNGFSAEYLLAHLTGRRTPIKSALLDQTVVAGLGNIYVCEALFYAGISPRRKAANVGPVRAGRLVAAIKRVLAQAIRSGGSSLRDYADAHGRLGYFQHAFAVYDRAGRSCVAPGCEARIQRIVQSNRSTFFCPRCQR